MVDRSSGLAFANMMMEVGGLLMLVAMICCTTALVAARGHCRSRLCRQSQIVGDGDGGGIRRGDIS